MRSRLRGRLLAAIALPAIAHAQAPPPQPGIIERIAPAPPPSLGPSLTPPEPSRATGPGESRRVGLGPVLVKGNRAVAAGSLRGALAPLEHRTVTLAEIETARLAVLHAYRSAGFPYTAVHAALLPQPDGTALLRLQIIEGHVVEVILDGEDIGPAARQIRRFLAPLLGERPLSNAALERALLLASDMPGVTARGVLRPVPAEPGALQLVVQVARRPISGFASLDNRGYSLTGAWQGLLVSQLNAFTGLGERTEIAALQTEANGQSFLQVTEEFFLGGSGLRLRAFVGAGRAAPGSPLAAIGYAGQTRIGGLALSYPLIRSRPLNLSLSAQLDAFDSEVAARNAPGEPRSRQSRDAVRALRLGAEGAMQDAWLPLAPAAATMTGMIRLHRGLEAFGASDGGAGGTARAGSDFGFTRLVAEATRLQPVLSLGEWLVSLQGSVAGQWSADVLPPAEKFYLGGHRLGRGFYAGQVAGDRALGLSGEVQAGRLLSLPAPSGEQPLPVGTQLYLFRDEGRAWDNGVGGPDRQLASWGGGVRLQFAESLQLELEAVRRLTRRPEGAGVERLDSRALFARLLLRF